MQDPLSNFLVKLNNAARAGLPSISVPYSKFMFAVAEVLRREGFLESVIRKSKKSGKPFEAVLAYRGKEPVFGGYRRISRISRRLYVKNHDIFPVRGGFGKLVLTTTKGVLTGDEARKARIGGEPLFEVW
jgi:small subunit ribosomal protein S8